jgi:predicted secreted protein
MPFTLRRQRFAYVAHCLLNQNSKVDEFAICPGAYTPLLVVLREQGYLLRQLPCPELAFGGFTRFWNVREQYETPGFRRHALRLARPIAALIELDLRVGDVLIVGINGSPTMGVELSPSGVDWGGRPDKSGDYDCELVEGPGVFVAVLLEELERRGLSDVTARGLGTDLPDFDSERDLAAIAAAVGS